MVNIKDSEVASFYSGKSVFVTGGTGFIGKTLIEKLLYSCSGIDKLYVLVRDKFGKRACDRLVSITSSPAFDRLRASRPQDLKKIIIINGDMTRKNLGLPDYILQRLEDEYFTLAASVELGPPLENAMRINLGGTEHVIELCHRIKKLEALVHVSTAYSNSDRKEIGEEVYPMSVSLDEARRVAEMYSHDAKIIRRFLDKKPNTYTFSKAFAEELVMKQCQELPVSIVRPSIVISAVKEPCPGWIDTWCGATGLFVGMSAGILKVVRAVGSNTADLVPVDLVTNLLIVAATKCQKSKDVKVYNCCTGTSNPITNAAASAIARRMTLKHSLNEFPWPFLLFTPNVLLYTLITFILQILPAHLIDLCSILTGKKAIQMKLQIKLKKVIDAVKFFLINELKFSDDNMRNIFRTLSPEDKETFNFDVKTINWETCIENFLLGARKYL